MVEIRSLRNEMGKTSIKSSTVVPHALYQFPAVRDRRTKSHSTWTDRKLLLALELRLFSCLSV